MRRPECKEKKQESEAVGPAFLIGIILFALIAGIGWAWDAIDDSWHAHKQAQKQEASEAAKLNREAKP